MIELVATIMFAVFFLCALALSIIATVRGEKEIRAREQIIRDLTESYLAEIAELREKVAKMEEGG